MEERLKGFFRRLQYLSRAVESLNMELKEFLATSATTPAATTHEDLNIKEIIEIEI